MLEDVKNIFVDAPPILDQLVEFVHKFNEYLNKHDKLLQREKINFENNFIGTSGIEKCNKSSRIVYYSCFIGEIYK